MDCGWEVTSKYYVRVYSNLVKIVYVINTGKIKLWTVIFTLLLSYLVLKPGRNVRSQSIFFWYTFLFITVFAWLCSGGDTRYNSDLKHYHIFIYMVTQVTIPVTTLEFKVKMFLRVRNMPLFVFDKNHSRSSQNRMNNSKKLYNFGRAITW